MNRAHLRKGNAANEHQSPPLRTGTRAESPVRTSLFESILAKLCAQVLAELLTNAFQFSPPSAKVCLRVPLPEAGTVSLEVVNPPGRQHQQMRERYGGDCAMSALLMKVNVTQRKTVSNTIST
eukprot:5148052-Pleurochrysis_carterae.AAC.2